MVIYLSDIKYKLLIVRLLWIII